MPKILSKSFIASLLFTSTLTLACQYDSDCKGLGSTCQKSPGSMNGWCVGEFEPSHRYELSPPSQVMDIESDKGIPCSKDEQCGEGGRCVKQTGVGGVCL